VTGDFVADILGGGLGAVVSQLVGLSLGSFVARCDCLGF